MTFCPTPPPFRPIGPPSFSTDSNRSRDQRFDLNPFRGVLCLWIVGIHLGGPAVRALAHITGVVNLEHFVYVYRLGVECFFVLTGFLLAHSIRRIPNGPGTVGQLVFRRTLRLIVPYQIALALAAVVLSLGVHVFHRAWDLPDAATWVSTAFVVGDLVHVVGPVGSFWSMQPMFQFYLATAGLLLLIRAVPAGRFAGGRAADWGLAVIAISSVLYYGLNLSIGTTVIYQSWSLPYVAWLMAAGMLTYRVATRRHNLHLLVGVVLFAGVVNAVTLATGTAANGHTTWGFKLPFAATALYVLARGYQVPRYLPVRLAAGIGRYSYSIYLTHMTLGSHLTGLVLAYVVLPEWTPIALFLPALAVSVLSGVAFYHLVEVRFIAASRRLRPEPKSDWQSDRTPPLGIKLPAPA
jgi:peptidoglycan/LPS O-acetylase OafA/YrhL